LELCHERNVYLGKENTMTSNFTLNNATYRDMRLRG
jgi:hypothetical protein